MTKAEALKLYMLAASDADMIQAAHAMASVLKAGAPSKASKKKNVRRGDTSRAYVGIKLPKYQKQNCGHYFNSSGCAVCPHCPQPTARFIEGPYTPDVIVRRNAALGL